MAVYTKVSAEEIDAFLTRYDVGTLVSAKGIAEGVENSNFMIETTQDRFILTLYEKRVDPADLPFFIAMLDHLAAKGCSVPPMIADKSGEKIQQLCGKSACLIKFLSGVSVTTPTPAQAFAAGAVLGEMHSALVDFSLERPNSMDHDAWRKLASDCGSEGLDKIFSGLGAIVYSELDELDTAWPDNLEWSVIHADLFPDNVLMLGDKVTGLIDFYFSCSDVRAYDIAVTHAAWCFAEDGSGFDKNISIALLGGYAKSFEISDEEREALPVLARGAALRFLLTRAFDWINTPADALVTRKDPTAFLRRLQYYQKHPEVFNA
ncbi:homoserine kinase [Parasphingorhabdus halotolerans]|uniref:Homoserine kinase n=1 Tax=Parasphingorhabdus halotolerans TaxID=2725558 RepID=A0A6H2DK50_9SPHN|nr:homoserine kinase [Parasphingorhabdus halotolerans]QJB69052.1 homoserine kinase [Parasphingorhabdus halotolerans]